MGTDNNDGDGKQKKAQACALLSTESKTREENAKVEIPTKWESLNASLDDWYRSSCAKYHAFALTYGGVAYVSDDSPMIKLKHNHVPKKEEKEWTITCLKCGVNIMPRRWKQYRTYPCKRVIDGCASQGKKRERPEEEGSRVDWDEINRAIIMMEEVGRNEGEILNARQRQLAQRWIEAGKGVVRRDEALRKILPALGKGGRQITLGTLNIGSLRGKMSAVVSMGDVVCLQETLIDEKTSRTIAREAFRSESVYVQGQIARVKRDVMGRWQPIKGQGMGVLHRKDISWRGIWKELKIDRHDLHPRIHSGWMVVESWTLAVHNVYMPPHNESWSNEDREKVGQEVIRRVRSTPCTLQVVLGDFQDPVSEIPAFECLRECGWAFSEDWPGVSGVPTYRAVQGESRQLDGILLSPSLRGYVENFEVVRMEGVSTHDGVVVHMQMSQKSLILLGRLARRKELPVMMPLLTLCRLGCGNARVRDYERVGRVKLQYTDVVKPCEIRKILGRPARWKSMVLQKAAGHLRELRNLEGRRPWTYAQARRVQWLEEKIGRVDWRAVGVERLASDWRRISEQEGYDYLLQITLETDRRNCEEISDGLARWRNRISDSLAGSGREGAAWVREERARFGAFETCGKVTVDPRKIVEAITKEWNPVFVHTSDWSPEGIVVPDQMPSFQMGELTGEHLMRCFKSKAKGSAGAEGLSLSVLKLLPLSGWQDVSEMFQRIEDGESWPRDLTWIRMAPIPKPGAPNPTPPGKIRLLTIESILTRCWSSLRAAQLVPWLQEVAGAGVIGALAGRSATRTATRRDLQRLVCEREEICWGEVSFDMTKCFDSLPRNRLVEVAVARGMPKNLGICILRFLQQCERHVCYLGWTGEALMNQRGVPQGSALSVVLAIVWAGEWERQCRSLLSKVSDPIAYLDDLSVSSTVESDISRTIGITLNFTAVWNVQLNPGKSSVVLSRVAQQKWNFDLRGVPMQSAWDFLGIQLGWGKGSQRSRDRLARSKQRALRISHYPGPLWHRVKMMELMVPCVCYALSFEKAHYAGIKTLTSQVWRAIWGRTRFLAAEDWGAALILTHRACPLTHWWVEAGRHIWHCASGASTRSIVLHVWTERCSKSEDGVWPVFCQLLDSLGVRRIEGGRALLEGQIALDVNMSLSHWNHQVRWLVRCWWLKRTGRPMGEIIRLDWKALDTLKGKRGDTRRNSSETLLTKSYLTAAKQWEAFGDVSSRCRCGEEDTQAHRLYWCDSIQVYRNRAGWGAEEERAMMSQGVEWATRGIILTPAEFNSCENPRWNGSAYLDVIGPDIVEGIHDAHDLWVAEIYVQTVGVRTTGDCVVVGAIQGTVPQRVRFSGAITGLREKEAAYSLVLRIALAARVSQKACVIRCEQGVDRKGLMQWLADKTAPWVFVRGLLSSSDLSWVTLEQEAVSECVRDSVRDWILRNQVERCLRTLESQSNTARKLRDFVGWVGDGWPEVSNVAHQKKVARLRT